MRHLKGELIRSPYHDDEFIQVYLEEEVNALVKRSTNIKHGQLNEVESWRKRRNQSMRSKHVWDKTARGSEQTVIWAVTGNGFLFCVKSIVALNSGSASMVSEG